MSKTLVFRMRTLCVFALIGLTSPALMADTVFTGVQGASDSGTTGSGPGFTVGPKNNSDQYGGEGNIGSIAFNTSYGAMGEATANGFLNPILKSKSTGFDDEGVSSIVGMMATYQYNGTSSGTVTYDWTLDAILSEDDPNSAAFLRYRAGLISGADFYSTSYVDFFESSATVVDSINITSSESGTIDESGSLTIDVDPGEVFYLSTLLQTYGGRAGGEADAFNTSVGSFSVSGGSIVSLSAVPEPAAGSILALAGLVGLAIRRRK